MVRDPASAREIAPMRFRRFARRTARNQHWCAHVRRDSAPMRRKLAQQDCGRRPAAHRRTIETARARQKSEPFLRLSLHGFAQIRRRRGDAAVRRRIAAYT